MGNDKRPWRKLVKSLRRKRIRQKLAQERDMVADDVELENLANAEFVEDHSHFEDFLKLQKEQEDMQHEIEEEKWIEREQQAQLEFRMIKAREEKLKTQKDLELKKIREEWEEQQKREKAIEEERTRLENELKEKQEAEFDSFIEFLSGDIETPPQPYVMPEVPDNGKELCTFFCRTGVCLFSELCSRNHPRPTLSSIILIPNFFSHFSLEQGLRDEYDTDLFLEYEDSDIYKEFLTIDIWRDFYDDVLPELRKFGDVIQFKVCRNFNTHLRGNVYVQYKNIRDSLNAYRTFNGRFYNGKQLSLQFVKIDSWKAAVCGLFLRKSCLKGKTCNFLHVFRNPTKEFVMADRDWMNNPPKLHNPSLDRRPRKSSPSSDLPGSSNIQSKSLKHRSRSRSKHRPSRHRVRSSGYDRGRNIQRNQTSRQRYKHRKHCRSYSSSCIPTTKELHSKKRSQRDKDPTETTQFTSEISCMVSHHKPKDKKSKKKKSKKKKSKKHKKEKKKNEDDSTKVSKDNSTTKENQA